MGVQTDKTSTQEKVASSIMRTPALPAPSAQAFSRWANLLFESNRLEEALSACAECLKLNPEDMNAMYIRGIIRGLKKDKDGAIADLSLVLLQQGTFDLRILVTRDELDKNLKEEATASRQFLKSDKEVATAQAELEEINKDLRDILKVLLDSPAVPNNSDPELGRRIKETVICSGQITSVGHYAPHERLSCVKGLEAAKEALWSNVVLPVVRPDLFHKYKKKRGFAVLLYGPPGCGKTLLVRAIAGETDSCIVQAKLHELMDRYIGNTQKNIHALFDEARSLTRNNSRTCIVFLDELDSLGVDRGVVSRENSGSHRDAVDQLLMELDGLEKNPEGLFVIAATNRPWDIDVALKRSGRIGEAIYVNPPKHEDRKQLFRHYIRDSCAKEMDFELLASLTEGCSASDIENIVDKAKLKPIKREHETNVGDALTMEDLECVVADPSTGKGSLADWYTAVAYELSQEPLDETRYKPLLDDAREFLRRRAPLLAQTPCV